MIYYLKFLMHNEYILLLKSEKYYWKISCAVKFPKWRLGIFFFFHVNWYFVYNLNIVGDSQVVLVVKNLPANAGEESDMGLIPGLGRFPGVGNGNPLQYSCLENSMDRGAWQATVHRLTKSQTQLKQLSTAQTLSV